MNSDLAVELRNEHVHFVTKADTLRRALHGNPKIPADTLAHWRNKLGRLQSEFNSLMLPKSF